MPAPTAPYWAPYANVHEKTEGPGDARPTALQIIEDNQKFFPALSKKVILITGCSSGIGVETARALYETGAKLYLTARDIPKLEKVIDEIVTNAKHKDGPRPIPLEIHLDKLSSVKKAAEEFKLKESQLNILINNAGIMACPYAKTEDGFELQIGTNHFAHFLLFQLLKPTLLASAKASDTPSRVVSLSSAGHRFGPVRLHDINFEERNSYAKWPAYGSSKSANIWMSNSINRHYGSQGIVGLSVHPGGIMTELIRHLTEEDIALFGEGGIDSMMYFYKSPPQGAATTVLAAVADRFDDPKNGGVYLADCQIDAPVKSDQESWAFGFAPHAYDDEKEEEFWRLSFKLLGLAED
ncbi:NAD(P)-binding protein [Polychaeton citri CBS 116435]|uniref:NAD(P)-binding protein n=1 Tax=Polychaeton citri CBS 116435 TaxID=1314669 RepID=A0A9P4Q2X7_9PEZI|nr:NAD(P)-binding protein [Polychaeton citri CBS 116435]